MPPRQRCRAAVAFSSSPLSSRLLCYRRSCPVAIAFSSSSRPRCRLVDVDVAPPMRSRLRRAAVTVSSTLFSRRRRLVTVSSSLRSRIGRVVVATSSTLLSCCRCLLVIAVVVSPPLPSPQSSRRVLVFVTSSLPSSRRYRTAVAFSSSPLSSRRRCRRRNRPFAVALSYS